VKVSFDSPKKWHLPTFCGMRRISLIPVSSQFHRPMAGAVTESGSPHVRTLKKSDKMAAKAGVFFCIYVPSEHS
jgi:hypothetical protein